MENNQTTNQEKLVDDKRTNVEPKYVSIDEMSLKKFDEAMFKRYVQNAVYGTLSRPVYKPLTENYEEPKPETPEEWIWVDGYKATNAEMQCKGYQYELGKQHDMPDDEEILDCTSGFHFCRDLSDVFTYYGIHNGHRFFRVRALVRKKDFEEYGVRRINSWSRKRDKLVAKSIVFVRELTNDEVFKRTDAENWSEEDIYYSSRILCIRH